MFSLLFSLFCRFWSVKLHKTLEIPHSRQNNFIVFDTEFMILRHSTIWHDFLFHGKHTFYYISVVLHIVSKVMKSLFSQLDIFHALRTPFLQQILIKQYFYFAQNFLVCKALSITCTSLKALLTLDVFSKTKIASR